MTVIVSRVELFDAYTCKRANLKPSKEAACPEHSPSNMHKIEPFSFEWDDVVNRRIRRKPNVQVIRVKNTLSGLAGVPSHAFVSPEQASTIPDTAINKAAIIKDTPNPFPDVHDKYWSQRHRLFSRFDEGVQLDAEGWYSITPEVIADHVAYKLGTMASSNISQTNFLPLKKPVCIMEAFCGCGGNAVAFGRSSYVDLVVCIDIDRAKLRRAAHNASVYKIPPEKIIFIEANALTVLECYKNGELIVEIRDKYLARNIHHRLLMSMMSTTKSQHTEVVEGYSIGGVDLLPPHIHGVHIDPPWGGVDYGSLGSYDLTRNLFITQNDDKHQAFDLSNAPTQNENEHGSLDGRRLLAMTAKATNAVVYSLPRNTSKVCIGQAALRAGYRGNCEFEEQFLNGRLKCVSAYFGSDFRPLDMS